MAANKHQTFQQQFDRGPAGAVVVVAGAAQNVDGPPMLGALPITNSTGAVRHGGKQHDNHQPPASSIAIQVQPSTSSEELHHHRSNYHHHHHHYAETRQVVDKNNNNAPQAAPINRCHHEAATRTLLFHHNNHHNESSSMENSPQMDTTSDGHYSRSIGQPQYAQASTPPPNYHEIPGIVPAYQGRSSGPPPSYDDVVNPNAPPPSYQSLFGQVREARKTSNGLVDLLRQLFLILIGTLGCTMIIGFLLLIPITMILVGIVYVNECRAENIPTFLVIGGIVWIMKNVLNCYNQFKKDSSTLNRPPPRRSPISTRAPSSIQSTSGDSPATVLIVGQHQSDINNNNNIHTSSEHSTTGANTTTPILSTTTTTTIPMATTRTRRDLEHSANRIRTPSLIGITSFKCESMLNYFLIVWFFAGCIVVYRIYEPDYDNPLSQSYCHRTVYLYAFWLITSAFIIMAIVLSCLCCLMASSLMNCNHGR